jgi:hypothetical protein
MGNMIRRLEEKRKERLAVYSHSSPFFQPTQASQIPHLQAPCSLCLVWFTTPCSLLFRAKDGSKVSLLLAPWFYSIPWTIPLLTSVFILSGMCYVLPV